jgi:hypothetical protein
VIFNQKGMYNHKLQGGIALHYPFFIMTKYICLAASSQEIVHFDQPVADCSCQTFGNFCGGRKEIREIDWLAYMLSLVAKASSCRL